MFSTSGSAVLRSEFKYFMSQKTNPWMHPRLEAQFDIVDVSNQISEKGYSWFTVTSPLCHSRVTICGGLDMNIWLVIEDVFVWYEVDAERSGLIDIEMCKYFRSQKTNPWMFPRHGIQFDVFDVSNQITEKGCSWFIEYHNWYLNVDPSDIGQSTPEWH